MSAGDVLSHGDRDAVADALKQANEASGFTFNAIVAESDGGDARAHAEALHAATVDPARTVLIAVDPKSRTIEIVTGKATHRTLQDSECKLAAAGMVANFRAGDFVGGLVQGIGQLGESARALRVLHARDASRL